MIFPEHRSTGEALPKCADRRRGRGIHNVRGKDGGEHGVHCTATALPIGLEIQDTSSNGFSKMKEYNHLLHFFVKLQIDDLSATSISIYIYIYISHLTSIDEYEVKWINEEAESGAPFDIIVKKVRERKMRREKGGGGRVVGKRRGEGGRKDGAGD